MRNVHHKAEDCIGVCKTVAEHYDWLLADTGFGKNRLDGMRPVDVQKQLLSTILVTGYALTAAIEAMTTEISALRHELLSRRPADGNGSEGAAAEGARHEERGPEVPGVRVRGDVEPA